MHTSEGKEPKRATCWPTAFRLDGIGSTYRDPTDGK